MKKYLLMLAALFVGAVCFTSCGDDDDIDDFIDNIENVKPTVVINEKGNPMTMTITYPGMYTETHAAAFDSNNMCSSYKVTQVFKHSNLADAAWKEIQDELAEERAEGNEPTYKYSRDGKTIVCDMSADFKGKDRQYVLMVFDVYKSNIERSYND